MPALTDCTCMKKIKNLLNKFKNLDPRELEIFMAEILGKDRSFVITHPEYELSLSQYLKLTYFAHQRKRGYSVATIVGHKEFYGLDFYVNKHVLIPRPDTELMVAEAAREITNYKLQISNKFQNPNYKITLIDVGTGSGCVPISMLCHCEERSDEAISMYALPNNGIAAPCKSRARNDIQTYATDISRSALRVAKKNAKKHNVDIKFFQGNLLEPILKRTFDFRLLTLDKIVITANLPYLTEQQFQENPSIQKEPKNALVAKNNGLALYEELLKQIASFCHCEERSDEAISMYALPNNGIAAPRKGGARNDMLILLEIDPSQSEAITKLIAKYLPNSKIEIKKDLCGLDRIVKIIG